MITKVEKQITIEKFQQKKNEKINPIFYKFSFVNQNQLFQFLFGIHE